MSLLELIHSNFQDLAKRFGMDASAWEKYIEGELLKKEYLVKLVDFRHAQDNLWDSFQQGLPGTSLNAFCLYAVIRYFDLKNVVETGVANGFYTAFILSAVKENGGKLTSLEFSKHEDIAMYVSEKDKDYPGWSLIKGVDAAEYLKLSVPHDYDLCCHDSLHTKDHMSKEFDLFLNVKEGKDRFFVFFDDQNSEGFFEWSFNLNQQSKSGYSYRVAEGRYCREKGHLGLFLRYEKKVEGRKFSL